MKDTSERFSNDHKSVRKVHPLGMRVLVQIKKADSKTDRGEESLLAQVIEVASAIDTDTDEETNISGIPLGATVLVGRHAGTRVPWDELLRIVDTKEVLAIVDEVELI